MTKKSDKLGFLPTKVDDFPPVNVTVKPRIIAGSF